MKLSPKLIAIARWSLVLTASAATLLAVFVAVENWRGDRAWAECERDLKARGEPLDLAAFQPAPVPDHLNFFKTPLLERLAFSGSKDTPEHTALLAELRLGDLAAGRYTGPKDFPVIRAEMKRAGLLSGPDSESAATDVLTAMQRVDPILSEVRDAARHRPGASVDYGDDPFDNRVNISWLFSFAQALTVHASAELATDDVETAFADVFALLRLANSLPAQRPTLMNMLVAQGMQGLAALTIKEGCERHLWSDAQLEEFQRLLLEPRPAVLWGKALRGERAFALHFMNAPPESRTREMGWPPWFIRGWVQQNKVALCRGFDDVLLPIFVSSPDRIVTARLKSARATANRVKKSRSPYQRVSQLVLKNLPEIAQGIGVDTGKISQIATLCALERHRLAHGRYPAQLGDLVPRYLTVLPLDIFDGQPLRYTGNPGSGYQLHFVGVNERDDGGKEDDIVLTLPTS
jgi:hypothetical protein